MATDINKTLNLEDAINNLDTLIKRVEDLNAILVKFSANTETTAKSIDELNKVQQQSEEIIEDTTKASTQLEKIKAQNLATAKKLEVVYFEENEELIRNKVALNEATKTVRDKVKAERDAYKTTQEVNNALTTQAKTMAEAQKQNKALRKAVKELDTTTEEGQKKIAEYNSIIDENSKLIKENSDSYVQQKIQIGDYTIALDDVRGGFKKLGTQIKAFLANPLLLTITAIVGAFVALKDALGQTEDGQRLLTQASGLLDGVLTVLREVVVSLTKPLIALFNDPKQAVNDLRDEIKNKIIKVFEDLTKIAGGVGRILKGVFTLDKNEISAGAKEAGKAFASLAVEVVPVVAIMDKAAETAKKIGDTAKEQARINAARFDLEKERNKLIVDEARLTRDIAEQRRISQDATVNTRDQLAAIQKAEELTRELTQRRLDDKKAELRLLADEQELSSNNLEDNREYAQLQAEILKLEEQQANQLRTIQKRRETILNTLEKEKDTEIELQEIRNENIETNSLAFANQLENIVLKQEADAEAAQKEIDNAKIVAEGKKEFAKSTMDTSIELAVEAFGLEKELAIAKAGINIAEGITAAYKRSGPIRASIEAALITAAGAVQIGKIKGLNAYYKGTAYAKKGLALVSERGAELIQGKDGALRLIPDMSMINLEGGETIYTAQETKQMLFDDSRIIRELRRQNTNVIVNIKKDSFSSKYRFKA